MPFGEVFSFRSHESCQATERTAHAGDPRETFAARGKRRRPPIADTAADVTVTVQFRSHTSTERADSALDTQASTSFCKERASSLSPLVNV
jgi:hypothetical protein